MKMIEMQTAFIMKQVEEINQDVGSMKGEIRSLQS
jgi:hypothetical protein